jgi:hypothetical protein
MDGTIAEGARSAGLTALVPLGRVIVVGQSVPVELWTAMPGLDAPQRAAVTAAVHAFAGGDAEAAARAWGQAAGAPGASRLAEPFVAGLASGDTDGVLRLRAK